MDRHDNSRSTHGSSTSEISRSSRTSTTASRRWPTAFSRSPARCRRARWKRRSSTRWTSSASAASRSRRTRSACTTRRSDGEKYVLNLIDTPGHVDFSYEVTRSLAACEGALLLVDASQGVEAQTLANAYLAVENNLEIIPVINKIDLPSAQPEEARRQIEDIIGLDGDHAHAGQREGRAPACPRSSRRSSHRLPPPAGNPDAPLKALIFDSWYDPYRGVVIVVRVIDGVLRPGHEDPADGRRAGLRVAAGRHLHAEGDRRSTSSASARSASSSPTSRRSATRRSATRSPRPARPDARAVPGLQAAEADGVRRALSGRGPRVPRAARRAREAAAERRVVLLRAGDVGRARLRVPLRVPRPAAHGDRAGAARARVRHGPGDDGAGRAVPGDDDRRRRCRRSTARRSCPTPAASTRSRSRSSRR